jgi:hypothetical protein
MTQPNYDHSTPRAGQSQSATLFASAVLSASGAWTRSSIVSVEGARKLTLLIDYTADATSGTDGLPEIVPMAAYTAAEPAAGDATWFPFGIWGGTVTEAVLASGTLPTGTDFTGTPQFAKCKHEPLCITLDPVDADTDRIQVAVTIDVTAARWFQLMAHEAGDTSNPGTLAISYVLSA